MIITNKKTTKISIAILVVFLLFFSVKFYKKNRELTALKVSSELEVKVLQTQLDIILCKYDSLNEESNKFNKIKKNDSTIYNTKNVNFDDLLKDSLDYYSKKATEISLEIAKRNKLITQKTKSLTPRKTDLTKLSAENINVKGVKIYTDNFKASKNSIQQLRVCFTLSKNETEKSGSKKIYIQVVNPKNQIISKDNLSINSNQGIPLRFSSVSEINYNNNYTDVCDYVDLEANKTVKGKYIINIYSDFVKIGTTIFEY